VHQGKSLDQPPFWPKVIEALGNTYMYVVACSANMDCPVGQVPQNFLIRRQMSHQQVLHHAAAAISSANTTSVLALLAAGVPSLLIPGGGEQPDVAERCQLIKAARCLPPGAVSKERLLSELTLLLEEKEIRDTARCLSIQFTQANTFNRASDLIEVLARTGKPVIRSNAYGLQASA
jgi:UDP:flavonoid glycosyltransferase YjiC (YdhE family)